MTACFFVRSLVSFLSDAGDVGDAGVLVAAPPRGVGLAGKAGESRLTRITVPFSSAGTRFEKIRRDEAYQGVNI
jgi:hypothetical protein